MHQRGCISGGAARVVIAAQRSRGPGSSRSQALPGLGRAPALEQQPLQQAGPAQVHSLGGQQRRGGEGHVVQDEQGEGWERLGGANHRAVAHHNHRGVRHRPPAAG